MAAQFQRAFAANYARLKQCIDDSKSKANVMVTDKEAGALALDLITEIALAVSPGNY